MNKKIAVINTLANAYSSHRRFKGLFSWIKTVEGSNIFVSPAVLLIATYLKKYGYTVRIYNDLKNEIDPNKMDEEIILISSITSSAKRAYEIAGMFPGRKIIMGGVHVSSLPKEAIKYADHVVVGECESVLKDIIEGKIKDKIVYGKWVKDIDQIPYLDYSLLDKPPDIIPVQTSRGCSFKCNYCIVPLMYGPYRYKSPKNVINELLAYQKQYGEIKKIDFRIDADFTFHRKRALEIFKRMKAEGIKPKVIATNSRLQIYKDKELLSCMSDQNVTLCVGIESLNQTVLDAYNKNQLESDIIEAINVLHDYNIKILGYFLYGADEDDQDTLKQYADFIHKSKLDYFHVSALTPYPGTGVYKKLLSQKRIFTHDWNYYDGLHVTFKPHKMTAFEMQKKILDFYVKEFSVTQLINPVRFLHYEKWRHNFLIYLLIKIFKKDMLEYLSFLKKHNY